MDGLNEILGIDGT